MFKANYKNDLAPHILGFFIWLMIVFKWWPFSFFSLNYVQILILSAPLFLIGISLKNGGFSQKCIWSTLLISVSLAFSFSLEQGLLAGLITIPWLVFCFFLLFKEIKTWQKNNKPSGKKPVRLAAFIYLLIGAFWLLADRLDFQPLNFDPTIVLLTAAHFHFAGYLLLMIASWIISFFPAKMMKGVSIALISGVPLVAIGITTSHFGFPAGIETVSVIVMVAGGASTGFLHLILGWRIRKHLFGLFWMIAGIALVGGMALALLYGLRNIVIISFLTIPWMYAVHGTLNAIGFALPAVIGWFLYFKKEKKFT